MCALSPGMYLSPLSNNGNSDLIKEYRDTRRRLQDARERSEDPKDRELLGEMISDVSWAICVMRTGYPPQPKPSQEIPMDPAAMDELDPRLVSIVWGTYQNYKDLDEQDAQERTTAEVMSILTRKQRQVLDMYLKGTTQRSMAKALNISRESVRDRLEGIFKKFEGMRV